MATLEGLGWNIEALDLSTPFTAVGSVREGAYLLRRGLSPYASPICRHPPQRSAWHAPAWRARADGVGGEPPRARRPAARPTHASHHRHRLPSLAVERRGVCDMQLSGRVASADRGGTADGTHRGHCSRGHRVCPCRLHRARCRLAATGHRPPVCLPPVGSARQWAQCGARGALRLLVRRGPGEPAARLARGPRLVGLPARLRRMALRGGHAAQLRRVVVPAGRGIPAAARHARRGDAPAAARRPAAARAAAAAPPAARGVPLRRAAHFLPALPQRPVPLLQSRAARLLLHGRAAPAHGARAARRRARAGRPRLPPLAPHRMAREARPQCQLPLRRHAAPRRRPRLPRPRRGRGGPRPRRARHRARGGRAGAARVATACGDQENAVDVRVPFHARVRSHL
eukprot:scaffold7464_cov52-Phaeocystis_antarctica.AAC.3